MIEYIREQLSQEELLCQLAEEASELAEEASELAEEASELAEEASELAQAALKLRRVYDGSNPTPVKRSEAFDNLKEEIADVELVLMVLGYDRSMLISEKHKRMDAKLIRWADRLRGAKNE